MNRFFKARNATELPYVEVYLGQTCVEALVLPPSRVEQLSRAMAAAQTRMRQVRWRRERRSLLQVLERARERDAAARDMLQALLSSPNGAGAVRNALDPTDKPSRTPRQARAAPLRGATGGRRKGLRGGNGFG